ncbi:hypothetical protein [Treponema sp. Marseille-Q4523]|uniref:hypothetical protein n=1 Tax=Treponema sp. Marseille-Q4523 TaxID=2810610 RepID=UPI0019614E85|nr:hypothetical protein [Treponema sp. Marseille-Q4523]MBM7022343.1 hypothetical protein [Treponema sp. Marseille-Q4523]
MKKTIKRMADEHVGKFQGFRNSKLIIVKRTSSFARESIKASFTAAVCLSIFFVSCASLPKDERAGDNRTQTESVASSRQSEHRDGISESAENENAAIHENIGGALQKDESSSAAGTSESVLADEAKTDGDSNEERAMPDTEKVTDAERMPKQVKTSGKLEDAFSNEENLSERIRGDLPEKSEEAMRGSSAIDEPVVREGFSENDGAGFTARNETHPNPIQKDAAPKDERVPTANAAKENAAQIGASAAQTSANAAVGNTKRAGTDAAQKNTKPTNASGETTRSAQNVRSAEAAQKTKGGTSEKTINPAKSATDDARSTKDTNVGAADKSASSTDSSREQTDPLDGMDEIDTKILPSRSVHIAKNQYLDVVYPGGGWIYLGETDGTKLLSFFGKKLGDADTIFTLRAKNAGRAILHFYKNDILTGDAIDDRLEVIVEDKVGSAAERITAPSYADIVPPRPVRSENEAAEGSTEIASSKAAENGTNRFSETAGDGTQRFSETTESRSPLSGRTADSEYGASGESESGASDTTQMQQASADENDSASSQSAQKQTGSASAADLSADDYALDESGLLEKAKSAYDEKNYARTLALLDLFFVRATSRIDEGLYLKGQTLEAKSARQNIKGALGAYDELLQNWPESKQWQSARKRSIYLKRMYVDIR